MSAYADRPPLAILSDRPCDWVGEIASRSPSHVDVFTDAWELRRALLAETTTVRRVIVGPVESPTPINAAAAIAKDARALSVTLVADALTGSLLSRAHLAGITEVMDVGTALRTFAPGSAPIPVPPAGRPDLAQSLPLVPQAPATTAPIGPTPTVPAPGAPGAPATPSAAILPDPYESLGPHGALSRGDADPEEGEWDANSQLAPKIVLISGRGGVGKSAICALMAATAASWGLDVAIVDLDLGFGNLFGYFGLHGPADLTRLGRCEGVTELGLCGKEAGERVTLFGPCARPEYAETVAPKVTEMLDALAEAHELVIVDGGTSWGDGVAQAVQAADRLLVCSDERSGAVGSLARTASLAVRLGVARTRICQLINRCDPKHHDEGFLDRAVAGFPSTQAIHIEEGGVEVAELMSVGRATDLVNVPNPFTESVARSLGTMLSELGILPENERALRAIGAKRTVGSRRGGRGGAPMEGRWAA